MVRVDRLEELELGGKLLVLTLATAGTQQEKVRNGARKIHANTMNMVANSNKQRRRNGKLLSAERT